MFNIIPLAIRRQWLAKQDKHSFDQFEHFVKLIVFVSLGKKIM